MMTKELRIPIAELRYLTIECPKCQTAITFDLGQSTVAAPSECPSCREKLEPARLVATFHEAFQEFRNSPTAMSFKIETS